MESTTTTTTTVVNFKLNESNEIEYADEEDEEESAEDGSIDDDDEDDDDDGPTERVSLVRKGDGVMTIRQLGNNSAGQHLCAKCERPFKTAMGLKRHTNLCRHLPKMGNVTKVPNLVHDMHSVGDEAAKDDKCFCCFEEIGIAHHGFIACNFCPKSFTSHVHLERHLYTLHSATSANPCSVCNAKCPNPEILELHMATHDDGKPFSCQKCGKDFTRKYHLDRHLEFTGCDKARKKQQLPCNVCNKMFTRLDNLREHLRVHLGQPSRRKEYECPFCAKKFYGSSLLNIHIRTHTGERPFPCDLCDSHFPSNGALRKHRRKHTGERPYSCTLCNNKFSVKETLNRHMKTHTGERPHKCDECGQAFIQATQLRAHMAHHSTEAEFACDICETKFFTHRRLGTHMRKLHMIAELFKCDVCQAPFKLKSRLAAHLQEHIRNAAIEQRNNIEPTDGGVGRPKRKYTKRTKFDVDPAATSTVIKQEIVVDGQEQQPPKRRGRPAKVKLDVDSVILVQVPAKPHEEPTIFSVQHVEEVAQPVKPTKSHPIKDLFDKAEFAAKSALDLHKKTHSPKSADRSVRCKLCKQEFSSLSLLSHMKNKHLDDLMTMVTDDDPHETESTPAQPRTVKRPADTPSHPNRFKIRTSNSSNADDDDDCNEYEVEIIHVKDEPEDRNPPPPPGFAVNPCDVPIILSSDELTENITKLLNLLVDEATLAELGWPAVECEAVLADVIAQCGQTPADRSTCPDYETVMRENTKLLFTTVINNDSIKSLLNNHSVDEVILHVLKLAS